MTRAFATPHAYLLHVQERYALPFQSLEPNEEFRAELERVVAEAGLPEPLKAVSTDEAFAGHRMAVESLWDDILRVLPADVWGSFKSRVAVGCVEHMQINAASVRSVEGWIAVIVNNGLLTFFNKILKLYAAAHDPRAVRYCNRGAVADGSEYISWVPEMVAHYKRTHEPLGPQIVLAPRSYAAGYHGTLLRTAELFVLAHEIGHVILGHLDEPADRASDPDGDTAPMCMDRNWSKEHAADVAALQIVRKVGARGGDDRSLLAQLVVLFDTLFSIEDGSSRTHPDAISRLLAIVAEVYGEEMAVRLEASYQNPESLFQLFSKKMMPRRG